MNGPNYSIVKIELDFIFLIKRKKLKVYLFILCTIFDKHLSITWHQLRHLEEIRGCNRSPKSSCASTTSSGTVISDGNMSSLDFSPRSLEKHCRPINHVKIEAEVKGTLIERLDHAEERVLKVKI